MSQSAYKTIILIDDDLEFVEVIQEILEAAGHTVRTASALTFTSLFREDPPDVFIIDVWFGENINSLNFITALRMDNELNKIPILLISSDTNMERVKHEGLVTEFYEKPLNVKRLLDDLKAI